MPSIRAAVTISAAPDDVWAILSDMPATRQWLPGVVAARMDGDVRLCSMADGQDVRERITGISDPARSFRFDHLKVPLPVKASGGTFAVRSGDVPGSTVVVLETTFEPLDPTAGDQLTAGIRNAFQQSLDSLRRYVEEGTAWDAR